MNAYWMNYLFTAERYIRRDVESFRFVPYERQQEQNETAIGEECRKLGVGAELLNVSRQFYNTQVVLYKREPTQSTYDFAMSLLADYNAELSEQDQAASRIQQMFKSHVVSETGTYVAEEECYGVCVNCFEPRMGVSVNLCADCYWDADASEKRLVRQNALSPR
jgi:hypothetical protein